MTSPYHVGDVVVFDEETTEGLFLLGTITSAHQSTSTVVSARAANGGKDGSGSGRCSGSATPRGGAEAVYGIAPQLTCRTIPSKNHPGRELARAVRYRPPKAGGSKDRGASAAATADGEPETEDIAELNERRLQLQRDIDTSRARVVEIDLYLQAREEGKAAIRQRSVEAAARAEREATLARAQLRSAKAEEWKRLLALYRGGSGSSRVLTAVVDAAGALAGTTPADTTEKEFEKKVVSAKVATVAAKRRNSVRKAEMCLRSFPARTVPAEQPLLAKLHRWLQVMVTAVAVHRAKQESGGGATAEGVAEDDNRSASTSAVDKGAHKEGSPDPKVPHNNYARGQPVKKAIDDEEAVRVKEERGEHMAYVQAATEELAAIDDLIVESKAALLRTGLTLYVPASAIGGVMPQSPYLQEVLGHAVEVQPGEPVKLNLAVGTELVVHMTTLRGRPPNHRALSTASVPAGSAPRKASPPVLVMPPSPRFGSRGRELSASRGGSARSGSRGHARSPSAGGIYEGNASAKPPPTAPAAAPGGGGGAAPAMATQLLPAAGLLPLASRARTSSAFSNRELGATGAPGTGTGFGREDSPDRTLRGRVEMINASPRLPTPRFGAALLENSMRGGSIGSYGFDDTTGGGGTTSLGAAMNGTGSPDNATGSGGAMAAQERLGYQQKRRELEIRLERALQANPKEAELQLLRDELKGTKQELHRMSTERDTLLREKREKSQLSVMAQRMHRRLLAPGLPASASASDTQTNESEERERAQNDLAVIDELEEQLAAAHRRIQQLEANNAGPTVLLTAPAVADAIISEEMHLTPTPEAGSASPFSPPPSLTPESAISDLNAAASAPLASHSGALAEKGVTGGAVSGTVSMRSPSISIAVSNSEANSAVALAAAQQQLHTLKLQLAHEKQARMQLQTEVANMREDVESNKRTAQDMEERLNLALHAREQSQVQVAQQRSELEAMWSKLEETEAQLQEQQERVSAMRQRDEYMAAESAAAAMSMPSLGSDLHFERATGGEANADGDMPFMPPGVGCELPSAIGDNHLHHHSHSSKPHQRRVGDPLGGASADASRSSSPAFERGRDASQSPQPVPVSGGGGTGSTTAGSALGISMASGPSRGVGTQPVEHMSAVELRHEVRQLRDEVERLQSSELRLSTELAGLRSRVKDERNRRQQARTVRLQMLNRLQEAVQHAMETGNDMSAVPDIIERTRQETEVILQHSRVNR